MDITKEAKKLLNLEFLGQLAVGLILFNLALGVVGMFAPQVPDFVNNPLASIKGLFGKKAS